VTTYTRDTLVESDEVGLTILGIERIEWVGRGNSVYDDDNLYPEPNWPSGVVPGSIRVFPGARAVGGVVGSAARDIVDVRVTLSVAPPRAR